MSRLIAAAFIAVLAPVPTALANTIFDEDWHGALLQLDATELRILEHPMLVHTRSLEAYQRLQLEAISYTAESDLATEHALIAGRILERILSEEMVARALGYSGWLKGDAPLLSEFHIPSSGLRDRHISVSPTKLRDEGTVFRLFGVDPDPGIIGFVWVFDSRAATRRQLVRPSGLMSYRTEAFRLVPSGPGEVAVSQLRTFTSKRMSPRHKNVIFARGNIAVRASGENEFVDELLAWFDELITSQLAANESVGELFDAPRIVLDRDEQESATEPERD